MEELRPLEPGELTILNDARRWGRTFYPIAKRGRAWWIDDRNGFGGFPCAFKTKREAIEQAFFAGKARKDMASSTGEPLGTVKARVRRGIKALGAMIEREL